MNKSELIAAVAEETKLTKKEAEKAVSAVFSIIECALKKGEKVSVVGFGAFEAKKRPARKGHNPVDGSEIVIPASVAPTFKAGKGLKDSLN